MKEYENNFMELGNANFSELTKDNILDIFSLIRYKLSMDIERLEDDIWYIYSEDEIEDENEDEYLESIYYLSPREIMIGYSLLIMLNMIKVDFEKYAEYKNKGGQDMKKFKENKFVSEQLEKLGLDKESVTDYDQHPNIKDFVPILADYFYKRDSLSNELDLWILDKVKTPKEMGILISIITEHIQNLIIPDREYFMDLAFKSTKEANIEFDHWINVQTELEKLHLSSMSEYMKKE